MIVLKFQQKNYQNLLKQNSNMDKKNDRKDKTSGHLFIGGGCEKIN